MPKKIYDIESLLDDIESILKAGLNTKITEINAEVIDDIVMKTIDSDAYFLQELNSKTSNWNPIVLYGVSNIDTMSNGQDVMSKVSVEIIIIFEDNGIEKSIPKLAYRYNRALKDVIRDNWSLSTNANKLEMEDLLPIPYTKLNSSQKARATGIKILTSIA